MWTCTAEKRKMGSRSAQNLWSNENWPSVYIHSPSVTATAVLSKSLFAEFRIQIDQIGK